MKVTLGNFLSLLIQAKKQGTGRIGNGKLIIRLLAIICDTDSESDCLQYFTHLTEPGAAFHAVDKRIAQYLKTGQSYPYEKMRFTKFTDSLRDIRKFCPYLQKMQHFCETVLDESKTERLICTLA